MPPNQGRLRVHTQPFDPNSIANIGSNFSSLRLIFHQKLRSFHDDTLAIVFQQNRFGYGNFDRQVQIKKGDPFEKIKRVAFGSTRCHEIKLPDSRLSPVAEICLRTQE